MPPSREGWPLRHGPAFIHELYHGERTRGHNVSAGRRRDPEFAGAIANWEPSRLPSAASAPQAPEEPAPELHAGGGAGRPDSRPGPARPPAPTVHDVAGPGQEPGPGPEGDGACGSCYDDGVHPPWERGFSGPSS